MKYKYEEDIAMAKENVKKFIKEISENKELQGKFTAAQKGYEPEGKSEDEIFEDIVLPIAKEAGYEFTMSEYRAAQRDVMAEKGISEEELENVSGGGACFIIGFGNATCACIMDGVVAKTSEKTSGIGFSGCEGIGFGFGGVYQKLNNLWQMWGCNSF